MKTLSTFVTSTAALAAFCTATIATAQIAPSLTCPANYELQSGTCFNQTNGDVVLAEVKTAAPVLARAQCRPGYEIMVNALCLSGKTGDVVYADMITGIQTANK